MSKATLQLRGRGQRKKEPQKRAESKKDSTKRKRVESKKERAPKTGGVRGRKSTKKC